MADHAVESCAVKQANQSIFLSTCALSITELGNPSGYQLIDIRQDRGGAQGEIPGAIDADISKSLSLSATKPLLIVGQALQQQQAESLCMSLRSKGLTVKYLRGGTAAWLAAGKPYHKLSSSITEPYLLSSEEIYQHHADENLLFVTDSDASANKLRMMFSEVEVQALTAAPNVWSEKVKALGRKHLDKIVVVVKEQGFTRRQQLSWASSAAENVLIAKDSVEVIDSYRRIAKVAADHRGAKMVKQSCQG
ncbi:rhodanese-like domain-containing protein [Sinobacterium caligoides]|uniref:rhodanese-like domain-containing protein n=1 Tax=Sinobacterium caligoides TaxID=933926 RepID=UPI0011CE1FB5|nr:rhodanese-like domain-containing protein [Sinobacterium caligoides]